MDRIWEFSLIHPWLKCDVSADFSLFLLPPNGPKKKKSVFSGLNYPLGFSDIISCVFLGMSLWILSVLVTHERNKVGLTNCINWCKSICNHVLFVFSTWQIRWPELAPVVLMLTSLCLILSSDMKPECHSPVPPSPPLSPRKNILKMWSKSLIQKRQTSLVSKCNSDDEVSVYSSVF